MKDILRRKETPIIMSVTLLIYAVFSINSITSIQKEFFVITQNFYSSPIFVSFIFNSVVISLMLTIHVARDIDSRVFESYLYGPVDEKTYILSIFISYSILCALTIIILPIIWILIFNLISGFEITIYIIIELLITYIASCLVLFIGFLLCAIVKRAKNALFYLLGIHLLLIGIIVGNQIVSQYLIPIKKTDADVFSFFRILFAKLYELSSYFSPYTGIYILQSTHFYQPINILLTLLVITVALFLSYFLTLKAFQRRPL